MRIPRKSEACTVFPQAEVISSALSVALAGDRRQVPVTAVSETPADSTNQIWSSQCGDPPAFSASQVAPQLSAHLAVSKDAGFWKRHEQLDCRCAQQLKEPLRLSIFKNARTALGLGIR